MRTNGYHTFPVQLKNLPTTPSGTVLGAFGRYYVLGPTTGIRAHSPLFVHTATRCGVNPYGPAPK
jgi:hypothetical protein